jgi:hypothetical protein
MIRNTNVEIEEKTIEFAKKAAKYFSDNKKDGLYCDMEPGSLLAVRWGIAEDCIAISRLDENFQPINFLDIIEG